MLFKLKNSRNSCVAQMFIYALENAKTVWNYYISTRIESIPNTSIAAQANKDATIATNKLLSKNFQKNNILCVCLILFVATINAQYDSILRPKKNGIFRENPFLKESIVPASLILTGILLSDSEFEEDLQENLRDRLGNDFSTSFDDHTRNIPIAQMYIADIAGIQARNHWFDQTKNLIISVLITDLLTMQLKWATDKQRPDGDDDYESWPSGHTSHAFATASVLYEEFKDTSPLLAYSGYLFAATTGYLRMANNRHYLSDVLAGAGLGILVTKLVYKYEHLFAWNPFTRNKNITLLPKYSEGTIGFYFVKKF